MNISLVDEDRHVVDLLLGGAGNSGGDSAYVIPPASEERLRSCRAILHLLDELPVTDPPLDLAIRTLSRLEATAGPADTHFGMAVRPPAPGAQPMP
jgi:hypothetical protein